MSEPLPERLAEEVSRNIAAGDGPGVYCLDKRYPTVESMIAAAIRAALDEAKKAVCPDCAEAFKLDAEGHHVFGALRQESPCPAIAIETLE